MNVDRYSITDLRRKSAEVVDALKAGETVALTHNGTVLAHIVPVAHQGVPQVAREEVPSGGSEVVDLLREQTALLRELVQQGKQVQPLEAARAPVVTVPIPEGPEVRTEPERAPGPHRVVVPQRVEDAKQQPRKLTPKELATVLDWYGLVAIEGGGFEINGRGLEKGTSKLHAQAKKGRSEAAEVVALDANDARRQQYVLNVQIEAFTEVVRKYESGESNWLPL
ncbi:type II toxin-antitoxin system Phd/YefM family antitoxin [Streptomyces sp. NPDC021020]|uniref:type II toxin-antitoxin system Phd/YefM family antitoxin n=1 Tax=Streptomyces sp. NPDC021020 TaxID=3365109 RepID=UPI0037BBF20C